MHLKMSSAKWGPCRPGDVLTYLGRVTHICVSKLIMIGADTGSSPGRRPSIIWTNAGILLIGRLGTNFSEISIEINKFSFKETWRHQMETFYALLALCEGNSPAIGEFPSQRPVTRSFDVFFHLRLNKRLSIQSWSWWFDTPSRSLWRHFNECIWISRLENGSRIVSVSLC